MAYLVFKQHGLQLLTLILLLILTACGGGGGGGSNSAPGVNLSRIEVTPNLPILANGTTLPLSATGIYSDNSSRSLDSEVTWQSANTNLATISSSGVISTLAAGLVTVQASLDGVVGRTDLTITSATLTQLAINPGNALLAKGSSLDISLTGTYSDGSTQDLQATANWNVANTAIASISGPGAIPTQLTGITVGATQLTASVGAVNTQINVTVSAAELIQLTISPGTPSLPLGTILNLSALGLYGDGSNQDLTTQVNWGSDDTGILTLDASGLLTPQSLGSTIVTASMAGITASQTATVSNALLTSIEVSASTSLLPVGEQLSFTALGHYSDNSLQDITQQVTWLSNPTDRLAISNASGSQGLATALTVGAVTASATLGNITGLLGLTTSAATLSSIDISPPDARLAAGTLANFQATGRYSDGSIQDISDQVSWATLDTDVATVSNVAGNQGDVQTLTAGGTTVTATLDSVSGNAALIVTAAQLLSISVLPAELSLPAGVQQSLSASGNFSDGSVQVLDGQVSWESDTPGIVAVSGGTLTALQPGTARVSASLTGVSGNANVTVTNATLSSLQISPSSPSLATGTNLQLQVIATYSDGSQADVTTSAVWNSADDTRLRVANISGQQGQLTALASGSVAISASLDGITDNVTVSIGAASLTGLTISAAKTSLDSAEQLQLTATGDFSDGSNQDLTAETVWSSDFPARAFVSNSPSQQGLVTAGIGVSGIAVITASYGGFNPTLDLTINDTPQRPVSLIVLATPNAILNDGIDSSTVEIRVQAADPAATVADGTIINLQISQAGVPLSSQNLVTTGGIASTTFTTTQSGLLQLQATVDSTAISNSTMLYSSATIYDVIAGAAFTDAQINGTTVLSGGRFGFFMFNLSNRDFPLARFELLNGPDTLFSTTDINDLNDNVLTGGLKMGIVITLSTDITDQGIEARYYLTDPATGNPFTFSVIFSSP